MTIQLEMIHEVQCPGCIHGTDPETCPKYKLRAELGFFVCKNWRPSSFMGGVGRFVIGLPRGFNRTGSVEWHDQYFCYLRLYEKPEDMQTYDKFNVPVWAMEKDGYLYVRCHSPRSNWLFVDVIKGGKLENASFEHDGKVYQAVDVGKFYDEID